MLNDPSSDVLRRGMPRSSISCRTLRLGKPKWLKGAVDANAALGDTRS